MGQGRRTGRRRRPPKTGPIVVLTGAGASAALGMPTMESFPSLLVKTGNPLGRLVRRMGYLPHKMDAEEIYGRLELYSEIAAAISSGDPILQRLVAERDEERLDDRSMPLSEAPAALAQLQGLMLRHWGVVVAPFDDFKRYEGFLLQLRHLNDAPLKVFTTNYDLTFEALPSFDPGGWSVVNGIAREIESLTMSLDLNTYHLAPDTAKVLAYRLHGCSHWFQDKEYGIVAYEPHPEVVRDVLRPMVVFPARGKTEAISEDVFAFAYRELHRALDETEVCVVIGYSFRDAGIRSVLAEAKHQIHFVVVEPRELDFEELLGYRSYTHISGRFGEEAVNKAAVEACAKALEDAEARGPAQGPSR